MYFFKLRRVLDLSLYRLKILKIVRIELLVMIRMEVLLVYWERKLGEDKGVGSDRFLICG